jgi:hypothetical protein
MTTAETRPEDDAAAETISRFRSPPGWACAIMRIAALSFPANHLGLMSANQIVAHFARIAAVISEELPDSDWRQELLGKLADLEQQLLIAIGAATMH